MSVQINAPIATRPGKGVWRRAIRGLRHQPLALVAVVILALTALAAIFAPVLAPYDPLAGDFAAALEGPSPEHWLGTDALGRDILSRLLYGAQVSWLACLEAVGLAVLIGIPLGLALGMSRGWFDRIGMRVVEMIVAVPGLVVAIAVIAAIGPGLTQSMFAIGIVLATVLARFTRGEVIAAREELYVSGARAVGLGKTAVAVKHVLPNIAPALIVQTTLLFSISIIAEAGLSFLGLGLPPPGASWGGMLASAQESLARSVWPAIPPGFAIFITVLAFNTLGDGLRDSLGRGVKLSRRPPRLHDRPDGTPAVEAVPADALLDVRNLQVAFDGGRTVVVDDLSFYIGSREIVALVGESGSGKTVTAMSLFGLTPAGAQARATSVRFQGRELVDAPASVLREIRGHGVGYIFQEPWASLNPAHRVGDQVGEVLRQRDKLSAREARERVVELLDHVGIVDPRGRADAYPHELSGGMAQRVMIAMALAGRPKLLIADEPTTALDVTVQAQVLDLLLELRERDDLSVLLITHDLGVVADVADRAVVMYAGEMLEQAPTGGLFARPRHPYTAGLLSAVPRNRPRTGRLPSIPGAVPQHHAGIVGCRFADRCAYVEDACREQAVPLIEIDGRPVRCRRAGEIVLPTTGEMAGV